MPARKLKSWFYKGSEFCQPLAPKAWIKEAVRVAGPYSGLIEEHCPLITREFARLRKDFDPALTSIEFGIYCRVWHMSHQRRFFYWPYAAIARVDGGNQMLFNHMVVPCLFSGNTRLTYTIARHGFDSAGAEVMGLRFAAVQPDTSTLDEKQAQLSPDDLGRAKGGVRDTDCWVMDTMRCPSVVTAGLRLGSACNYACIREALALVRSRLTFAVLPSA